MGNVLVSNLNYITTNLLVEKEFQDIQKSGRENNYHFVVKNNRFVLLQKSNSLLGRIWFQFQVFLGWIKTCSESKEAIRAEIRRLKNDFEIQLFFNSLIISAEELTVQGNSIEKLVKSALQDIDPHSPLVEHSSDDDLPSLITVDSQNHPQGKIVDDKTVSNCNSLPENIRKLAIIEFNQKFSEIILQKNREITMFKNDVVIAKKEITDLRNFIKEQDDKISEEKTKTDNIEKVGKSRLTLATKGMKRLRKEVELLNAKIEEKDGVIEELKKSIQADFFAQIQEGDLDGIDFEEVLKESSSSEENKSAQEEGDADSTQLLIRELSENFDKVKET